MESTRDSVGKMLVFLYAFYISEIKSIFNLFATIVDFARRPRKWIHELVHAAAKYRGG